MDKYVCGMCGYVYDPEEGDSDAGIDPGTAFEDLPDDWTCPICGVGKEDFEKEQINMITAEDVESAEEVLILKTS